MGSWPPGPHPLLLRAPHPLTLFSISSISPTLKQLERISSRAAAGLHSWPPPAPSPIVPAWQLSPVLQESQLGPHLLHRVCRREGGQPPGRPPETGALRLEVGRGRGPRKWRSPGLLSEKTESEVLAAQPQSWVLGAGSKPCPQPAPPLCTCPPLCRFAPSSPPSSTH